MKHQYSNFVILTTQRTGSTYIAHLLDSHPSVVSYGEIFHRFGVGWGSRTQRTNTRWLFYMRNIFPIVFLNTQVFHAYPSNIRAVGFKLMYGQATRFPSVLRYLANQQSTIIFLNRKNLLESLVSLKRAQYSRIWTLKSASEKPAIHIYIDEQECLNYFMETDCLHRQFCAYFKKNPSMQIYYEDVCQKGTHGLDAVQRFLAIPRKPLSSPITKLRGAPLEETVVNYFELKKKFSKTKWASFFP